MAKKYAILRFKNIKSAQALGHAYCHNYRETIANNVDPSRISQDAEIIKMEDANYNAAYKRRLEETGAKPARNNQQARAIEAILTYSDKLKEENFDVNKWVNLNVKWLQDRFGKENVVSVVLHLDETAPHLHAIIIPIVDGKLDATRMMQSRPDQQREHNGQKGYAYLQDRYAEYMTSLGLYRGITSSPATHEDLKDFKKALGKVVHDKLPEKEPQESIGDYQKRINAVHRERMMAAFKKTKEQEREIVELLGEIQNKPDETERLNNTIRELQTQLEILRKNAVTEKLRKQAATFSNILAALRGGYLEESARKEMFEQLSELNRAGDLLAKGFTVEEIKDGTATPEISVEKEENP